VPRGPRWTRQENKQLRELAEKNITAEAIFQSGKFPSRTLNAIRMQIKRLAIVQQKKKTIVEQIRPVDILTLEEVLKRFSNAFQQICKSQEPSKLELERYRIIFAAAKNYGPLLANYERLSEVEEEIAELRKMVEEIKAQLTTTS
jgi:hypothetical protein